MKAIMIAVAFIACNNCSFAQFKKTDAANETSIGKAKSAGIKFSELSYFLTDTNDTMYHYYYKNQSYKVKEVWDNVFFKGGAQVLNELYAALKTYLNADKGTENTFTLGETKVLAKSDRSFGTKVIYLAFTDKAGVTGITNLTGKQIDNLFNKESE